MPYYCTMESLTWLLCMSWPSNRLYTCTVYMLWNAFYQTSDSSAQTKLFSSYKCVYYRETSVTRPQWNFSQRSSVFSTNMLESLLSGHTHFWFEASMQHYFTTTEAANCKHFSKFSDTLLSDVNTLQGVCVGSEPSEKYFLITTISDDLYVLYFWGKRQKQNQPLFT